VSDQPPYGQTPEPVPPGWYQADGGLRWWDGHRWTEHVQPVAPGQPVVVTDARVNATEAIIAWIVAVFSGFYMLPWAVAATRGKSNSATIGLINLLLGWTVIGWVVALVMACTPHRVTVLQA
jgi:Superinfection immunity protein/Protein of unknown function (DUF2510)